MMNIRKKHSSRRANTLFEIITVILLISIAVDAAMPLMSNFFAGQAVKNEASNFAQAIRLGRYKALENQQLHRLIFSSDWAYYKLQAAVFQDEDYLGSNPSAADYSDYYDVNSMWQSILDDEEYEIDANVELLRSSDMPQCIFFWPNGTLVTRQDPGLALSEANMFPLGENILGFRSGEASIRVNFGYMGVISTEDYRADIDDDIENDEVLW